MVSFSLKSKELFISAIYIKIRVKETYLVQEVGKHLVVDFEERGPNQVLLAFGGLDFGEEVIDGPLDEAGVTTRTKQGVSLS